MNLALSFKPAFARTQGIFVDANGQNSKTTLGRQELGTWLVP
jgi:hypothetical protein